MSLFAVNREAGPAWLEGAGAFDQPNVNAHAAFMNGLVQEGFICAAGPLAGTERGRIRVLLIAEAVDDAEIMTRLSADPWELTQQIKTAKIEPWTLFAGAVAQATPEHRS